MSGVGLAVSCLGRHNCLLLTNLLICGCKTSLALNPAGCWGELVILYLCGSGGYQGSPVISDAQNRNNFWSNFRLEVARVAKLLLFNTKFKTWSSTCANPFVRKFVLNSELLWAVMKVLNLKCISLEKRIFNLQDLLCFMLFASAS